MDSSLYALYVTLAAALVLGVQAVDGVLEVNPVSSNIESLLGCRDVLICEGVGGAVQWRQKIGGARFEDVDSSLVTTVIDGDKVRSFLASSGSTSIPTSYKCEISGGPIDSSFESLLTVRNADVFIDPITDIDISDKSVGETLSFACNVFTCKESIEVALLKGSQLLTQRNFPDGKDVWVPVRMTISEDTADTYVCLATLPDGGIFNQTFSITGTPRRTPRISNPFTDINLGNSQPIQDSTARPSSTRRGSASINSPHIQLIIVSLLMLCLSVLLTL